MNNNFTNGFIKAARARGLSDSQITSIYKLAAAGMPPEVAAGMPPEIALAAPAAGAPPEAVAGGMPPAAAAAAGDDGDIEQLLSQLSPEELERLAVELAGDMDGGAPAGDDPQVHELAEAIAAHLQQNPEASLPQGGEMPPMAGPGAGSEGPQEAALAQLAAKTGSLNFVKSAAYIESFIGRAIEYGVSVKQAVDMYDSALVSTINMLSNPRHVVDTGSTKIAAANDIDEKTAAYHEGLLERAREYGLSDKVAFELVCEAMEKQAAPQLHVKAQPPVLPIRRTVRPASVNPPPHQPLPAAVIPPDIKLGDPLAPVKVYPPVPTAELAQQVAQLKAEDPGAFAKLWDSLVGSAKQVGVGAKDFAADRPLTTAGIAAGGAALGAGGLVAAMSGGGRRHDDGSQHDG